MNRGVKRRRLLGGLLSLAGTLAVRRAAALASPAGKPILTVSGRIKQVNNGTEAVFDRSMLEALGMEELETKTPWYDGTVRFEGVPMRVLLDRLGAFGTRLTVSALNDYTIDIPMEDFQRFPVLLALKRNGQYMPVCDKGPLFIVYPFDFDPELRSQKYYSRSAWQVASMLVA